MHLRSIPWTHQPPPGQSVPNTEHPCFASLRGLFVAAPTTRQADVYGSLSANTYFAPSALSTDGWVANVGSIYAMTFPVREGWQFQAGCTSVVRFSVTKDTTSGIIWGAENVSYGSGLRQATNGNGRLSLLWRPASNASAPTIADTDLPLNTFISVVMRDGAGLVDSQLWIDGALFATFPPYGAVNANFTQYGRSYDNQGSALVSIGAVLSGPMPEEECRLLSLNPWELLQPVQRRFVFPVTAAGAPLSSFWANVGGVPTRSLGLRAWNGGAVVTPVAKIWNGTSWEAIQ